MNNYKILHVFGKMDRGGAELRTLELMKHIDRNKYQFDFLALSGERGALDEEIIKLGGTIYYCDLKSPLFPFRLYRILKSGKYNVVHSHVHVFSGFILGIARLAKIKTRITHFRSTGDGKKETFQRKIYREVMSYLVNKNSTHVLAVSKSALNANIRKYRKDKERFKVIYNGLDLSKFQKKPTNSLRKDFGLPEEVKIFIHVGRMDPAKNHDKLISVFSEVVKQDRNVALFMVGKINKLIYDELKIKIKKWGIEKQVFFLGARNDVADLLLQADCMIFPSIREGLPGAVLEACAAGIPVLGSDIPSIREVAEYFPFVRLLDLNIEDKIWALESLNLLKIAQEYNYKKKSIDIFSQSPFMLKNNILAYTTILEERRL